MRRRALLMNGSRLSESKAYIFEIDTRNVTIDTTPNNQFKMTIGSQTPNASVNYLIDFGDGTPLKKITSKIDPNLLHTYASSGIYTIKIYPNSSTSRFITQGDITSEYADFANKLIKVYQNGFSEQGTYYGCINLTHILSQDRFVFYNNSFFDEFRECRNLIFINDIESWDVSSITNMQSAFRDATSFNQDISNWDVSKVINMNSVFRDATSFNQDLSNWNVSNVLNFNLFMWYANVPSTRVTDFSKWTFNKNVNFGNNFIQFQSGSRVFNTPEMDIFLQKLANSVIGTGRTETNKILNMAGNVRYSPAGKPFFDALVADGWTLNNILPE